VRARGSANRCVPQAQTTWSARWAAATIVVSLSAPIGSACVASTAGLVARRAKRFTTISRPNPHPGAPSRRATASNDARGRCRVAPLPRPGDQHPLLNHGYLPGAQTVMVHPVPQCRQAQASVSEVLITQQVPLSRSQPGHGRAWWSSGTSSAGG
jgi:hypothetical protein